MSTGTWLQLDPTTFGEWLRGVVKPIGVEDHRQLHRLLIRSSPEDLDIDQKTVERWWKGWNAPRPRHLSLLLGALESQLPKVRDAFTAYLDREWDQARLFMTAPSGDGATKSRNSENGWQTLPLPLAA